MRLSETSTYDSVRTELEVFESEFSQKCESLITTVINSPNFLDDFTTEMKVPKLSRENLLGLCYLSNFAGESRFYLQETLKEILLARYRPESRELTEKEKKILFSAKLLMQGPVLSKQFLLETDLWSTRDFFGNYLNKQLLKRLFHHKVGLRFKRPSTKIVKAQRKRGYDDKGSMRPSHCWKPSSGYQLNDLHRKIERERQAEADALLLIQGMLE